MRSFALLVSALIALAGCTDTGAGAGPASSPAHPPATQPRLSRAAGHWMTSVNTAAFAPPVAGGSTTRPGQSAGPAGDPDPVLIRAEVLLDRARFSPGVISGRFGENVHNAITAFEIARGLRPNGQLTPAVWNALVSDPAPALGTYVITASDVAGPFVAAIPSDLEALAKLPGAYYTGPEELMAERFHMAPSLLEALNPGVDYRKPGTMLVVASPGGPDMRFEVARIEVDKAGKAVRAFDRAGQLVASYPATIGSDDRPSPVGRYKVVGVAHRPTYEYDPSRLSFGHIGHKLMIPAGPNNPVGAVWIALSRPTFGIHGTPDPERVGKTQSHGCVRLTNWDALELAGWVKPGVVVEFIGGDRRSG